MNWHICAIAHYLEEVRLGKIKRLIITLPPRYLKSLMCSVAFPAFVLGHDPSKRVIVITYGGDLSVKHANDFRTVISMPDYRATFPAMRVSSMKNTQNEVTTTRNGFRLATSVDGVLTGRGADIAIIDDPISVLAALSAKAREHVIEWYFSNFPSRLDDKQNGSIVVVMQRLHEDDLVGVLLRRSNEWTVLNLPAIAEQDETIPIGNGKFHYRRSGDVLHQEREPMALLESLRAQLGAERFAAQYQQRPVAQEGVMIKREWIARYDELPRPDSPYLVQSWDVASKDGLENDWSVCTTWLIFKKRYYLVDLLRGRFDYPTLKAHVISEAKHHGANAVLIEDAGVGTALIQDLNEKSVSIIPVKPEFDKKTRMFIQCSKFESRRVLLPNYASWLADLELELFAFPRGKHDDQVDSISQALGYEPALSGWSAESLAGYTRIVDALWQDAIFGRLAGRPW